jgi:diguanylate cyclase (GGDEF)-like protein/PAS domain S-box-containing protein
MPPGHDPGDDQGPAATDPAAGTPLNVLILEDRASDSELMVAELRRSGFSPTWQRVETEQEYLAGLAPDLDVILADYSLPQFDALRALELRNQRELEVPFIIVSGSIGEEQAVSVMRQGAADYLLKDRLARLGGAVRHSLEQRQLRLERQQAQIQLEHSEQRFRLLAENVRDIIYRYRLGPTRAVEYVSPSTADITGYSPEDYYADPDLPFELVGEEGRAKLRAMLEGSRTSEAVVLRSQHKDGSEVWLEHRIVGVRDPGGTLVAIEGIARDVTERKQFEEQLAHQALHDPLTDLPNRALFLDRLTLALGQSKRSRRRVGVFFCDLDRFKVVNDNLGHNAGDHVLRTVADRLRHVVRPDDTVARLGGDEFVVLCADIGDERQALPVVERISRAIATPVPPLTPADREIPMTASVGVAISTSPDEDPTRLLRNADAAMYRAKQRGGARYEFFDEAMRAGIARRLETESSLRGALERNEFRLFYQPVIDVGAGRADPIVGFEALLRWDHPERGLVGPGDFIGVAEQSGLIVPIGSWVLEEACRQAARLQQAFPRKRPLTMAVNLSPLQFAQPGLVGMVSKAIDTAHLAEGTLCLEITETVLMDDVASTLIALSALRELGVQLAIDDFGIAYSSLNYLRRFEVDSLKVDRSFVEGLGTSRESGTIVAAVVGLAHTLGMTALAEGVETQEQMAHVVDLGCDEAQGFFFAHPAPEERLDTLLAEGRPTPGPGRPTA